MKHGILLSAIALLLTAAVAVSEHRKLDVPASPAPILYFIADTEKELTRLPVNFTRMSDEEEIRAGDELAKAYVYNAQSTGVAGNPDIPAIESYLTQVGSQVAANAHRKLPYKFHYLPEPGFVNAFALPGGHVYVGEGLLQLMDSEDELAAVLGHEVEHIDHFHCAERVQREEAMRKIPLAALMSLPVAVFQAGYSKDQELEADREGTTLAVAAGYSANGAVRMFATFARLFEELQNNKAITPQDEAASVAEQTIEGYFRSHPFPSERRAQINKLIGSSGWVLRPERNLTVAYIFLTKEAQAALDAGKYALAAQLANQALRSNSQQWPAVDILAFAQFCQGDFPAAAATARKALSDGPTDSHLLGIYAQSLVAMNRQTAPEEFRAWANSNSSQNAREVQITEAGLALLAGNPSLAQQRETEIPQEGDPKLFAQLGFWRYLAGDYSKAVELSSVAVQERPGEQVYRARYAWALIEVHRYQDALLTLRSETYTESPIPQYLMPRAVAYWLSQQYEPALHAFDSAMERQPFWSNGKVANALCSPLVAKTLLDISAERERRRVQLKNNR
jgi:beta-barrel assembly-enhancing protease